MGQAQDCTSGPLKWLKQALDQGCQSLRDGGAAQIRTDLGTYPQGEALQALGPASSEEAARKLFQQGEVKVV